MSSLAARYLIPILTFLLPGQTNWFTSNFSTASAVYPRNIVLLIWVLITGTYFHRTTKQIIGQAAPFLSVGKEPIMTDLAVILLIGSGFLPYLPQTKPLIAFMHLGMAFSSTVIFFFALTSLNLKLYQIKPKLFSLPTALMILAIAICAALLILCDFLITSALEIFITVFACYWIRLFGRRVFLLHTLIQLESEQSIQNTTT